MTAQATIGRLREKAACLLTVGALLAFSARFQWHRMAAENRASAIVSNRSELGFDWALCSLGGAALWVFLEGVSKRKELAGREPHAK